MLEVGQIFYKNNKEYCLIDKINYDDKLYVLFSVEKEKLSYVFYEVIENDLNYDFRMVDDEQLNFKLLNLFEMKESM